MAETATEFSGQAVLVTGGGGGIGRAIGYAFALRGAAVHLLDRDAGAAQLAADEFVDLGLAARGWAMDVTDEASVEAVMAEIAAAGGIDVLVNNAGIAIRAATTELPISAWEKVIGVNQTGVFVCSRTAARHMSGRGGAIVNVASIMGLSGGGIYPNISYQASKGAVVNMTRALAVEWASRNIRVNAVAPTFVRTELTRGLFENPETVAQILALTPLRQFAEPEDVAAAVVFLASPAARMITGAILPVDGGFLAQ